MTFMNTLPAPKSKQMADILMQRPDYNVKSPMEGLAKMLGEWVGAGTTKARNDRSSQAMADALRIGMGSKAGLDPSTGITWNQSIAPDRQAMIDALMRNPDTTDMGQQMAMNRVGQQFDLEDKIAETKAMMPYEIELAKAKARASADGAPPASVQVANEIRDAIKAGDYDRANLLAHTAKMYDKGINMFGNSSGEGFMSSLFGSGDNGKIPQYFAPKEVDGYGQAAGGIAGTKKGMEQNAKNASDLSYANPIAEATAIGKATGEMAGANVKKERQADDNALVIQNILQKDPSGRDLLDKANGSGIGAAVAMGKGLVGVSDEKTQANAELAIYGGQLLNNVPRMEGPQSDADVRSYKEQAGKIADPKIPAKDKRAALAAISKLKQKYATLNGGGSSSPSMPKGSSVSPTPVNYKTKYGLEE